MCIKTPFGGLVENIWINYSIAAGTRRVIVMNHFDIRKGLVEPRKLTQFKILRTTIQPPLIIEHLLFIFIVSFS